MTFIADIWRELKTPDGYPVDWYGYATNQMSHLAMGFAFACILSGAHFAAFDEFAEKWALWFVAAMVYAVYELAAQGWNGKDTVEDWWFFSVYGAGIPVMVFSEIEAGSQYLIVNSQIAIPLICVIVAHLLGGVIARIYLKVSCCK